MFGFMRKEKAPELPSLTTQQSSTQAGPTLTVIAGSDLKRTAHRYSEISELPEYRSVLTGGANPSFAVREALKQCVAALDRGSETLLLATDEFRSDNEYLGLRQRLGAAFSVVREATTSPSVLLELYGTGGKRVERREGDEALSVNLFRRIVDDGIAARCTDIHIIFVEESEGAVVLYRVDGTVRRSERIPKAHAHAAVGVGYNKLAEERSSSDPTFIDSAFQSAKIPHPEPDNALYNLRWQSIPTAGGFKVILRLLQTAQSKHAEAKPLPELGYSPDQSRAMYAAARKTKGMILIAGPTGSGKSTTLKTLMTSSPTRHRRIQYSIEDPVEYKMFGVSQISIQRSAMDDDGKQSLAAGRAILRGDPDELMVGEIRDREMASLLKAMVQSGHLVMSSVHAASVIEIVGRIVSPEIGIPRDVLDGRNFINALIYTALVRKLCVECRVPAAEATEQMFPSELKAQIREKFDLDPNTMFVTNPHGCECCEHTGTMGQTAIAEIVQPDQTMRKYFREGRDGEAEAYWRGTRWAGFDEEDCTGKTYLEHGLYKAYIGLIDPVALDEIEPFLSYEVFPKCRANTEPDN